MPRLASWTAGLAVVCTVLFTLTIAVRARDPQVEAAAVAPIPGPVPATAQDVAAAPIPGPVPAAAQDAPAAPADEIAEAVRNLVARMEKQSLPEIWSSVDRLVAIGKDAVPVLQEQMARDGDRPRLGCARALLRLGDLEIREKALAVLVELVRTTEDRETKIASIRSLTEHGEPEEVLEFLAGQFQKSVDPFVTIALAKALWQLDYVPEARAKMIEFLDSRDPSVRKTVALALAEIDHFDPRVKNVLRELRREPTVEGQLADALYRNDQLHRQLDKMLDAGSAELPGADPEKLLDEKNRTIRALEQKIEDLGRKRPGPGQLSPTLLVIDEIIRQIEEHYVDPSRLKTDRIIVAAAKGITRSLDRFTTFMDPEETRRFDTDMSGEYCGIGAQVGKYGIDLPLEILKPIYGGPAHRSGLLTGDQILEVDGEPTMGRLPGDIVSRLKGPEGSEIVLTVRRLGWDEPREFRLKRTTVEVPSVSSEMLPDKIGLIKLLQFGEKSFEEFASALDALEEDGMEALIVDLRHNPGGFMPTAKNIVDLFVGERKRPMFSVRGREPEAVAEKTYPTAKKRPDYPLVILVDRRSASASEIVAGALKDYHRATLVGERTYGKGTVQTLIPLSAAAQKILGGEARLKLTVKHYFLPSGRCVHTVRDENGKVLQQGGIEPNISVPIPRQPAWLLEEIERLRASPKLTDYVAKNFAKIERFIHEGDGRDVTRYPDFEALYSSLETAADRQSVRRLIRFHLRRKVEDRAGREFAGDYYEDAQLQRGILEALSKLGKDPASTTSYAWLKGAFPDDVK